MRPTIKVIIAGGRTFNDYELLKAELNILIAPGVFGREVEIVSGACDDSKKGVLTFTREDGTKVYGADGLGERYAKEYNFPVKPFPADWKRYGNAGGPIRNKQMADYATHCVCFWDCRSRGTKNMVELAKAKKIRTEIININQNG